MSLVPDITATPPTEGFQSVSTRKERVSRRVRGSLPRPVGTRPVLLVCVYNQIAVGHCFRNPPESIGSTLHHLQGGPVQKRNPVLRILFWATLLKKTDFDQLFS